MTLLSATYTTADGNGRLDMIRAGLRGRFEAWKVYRATRRELDCLSDRELADLGLSRSDIAPVAWRAAYGH